MKFIGREYEKEILKNEGLNDRASLISLSG